MIRLVLGVSLFVDLLAAQGWVDRTPTNPLAGPPARADAAMCWDDAHGYVLMVGGANANVPINDTWSWNGTSWTRRVTANLPQQNGNFNQRRQTAMTYHAPTNEVLLVCQGTTWTWTGSDWLSRGQVPAGPFPNTGVPHDLALGRDPVRNQTLMFVGWRTAPASFPTYVGETWLWDGFSWSLRPTATAAFPASAPSMTFDPAAGKLLMATTDSAGALSWLWEWNGSNWNQRTYAPSPAGQATLTTDVGHNQVVAFDGSLNPAPNHTWSLANGTCAQLATPTEPTHRLGTAMAFDPIRNRVVLFGGTTLYAPTSNPSFLPMGDIWEFELGAGAAYTTFGSGCTGSRGVPAIAAQGTSLPHAGGTFSLQVNNLPLTGPVFLFLGVSNTTYGPTSLPLSLGVLGAPGCTAVASGEALYLLTNVLGSAVWQFTVPNLLGVSFYNQAFAFDPPANALGLTVSNGGHATIGF